MPADTPAAAIATRIAVVRDRIAAAAAACGRDPAAVRLLAVSKTRSVDDLRAAWAAGCREFGENYLQEALAKIDALADLAPCWHFIGPIQSNKTRTIAERFDWVHSVDRFKVAQRLSEQRPAQLPPLQICVQVNISGEPSKSGVAVDALEALVADIVRLPRLTLRGLMAIPAATADPVDQRRAFAAVRAALAALQQRWPALDTLSMGMSGDLEAAIAEGATLVRIGTDIFGARA